MKLADCHVRCRRPYALTDGEAFNNETEARESGKVFKVSCRP